MPCGDRVVALPPQHGGGGGAVHGQPGPMLHSDGPPLENTSTVHSRSMVVLISLLIVMTIPFRCAPRHKKTMKLLTFVTQRIIMSTDRVCPALVSSRHLLAVNVQVMSTKLL